MSVAGAELARFAPTLTRVHADAGGALEVWRASLDLSPSSAGALAALLAPDERDRAQRLRSPVDHDRFVAGRALMRLLVARRCGRPPAELRLVTGPHGKPRLAGDPPALAFNLTRSGGVALVAISSAGEVGIDVELDGVIPEALEIARRRFTAAEAAAIAQAEDPERSQTFLRCWTRKEAVVKAVGEGLGAPLDSFAVSVEPGAAELVSAPSRPRVPSRWRLLDLSDSGQGYHAAAAVCSPALSEDV